MLKYLFFILILLSGCDQPAAQPPQAAEPVIAPAATTALTQKQLFLDPIQATLLETAAEALPGWREYADQKPALLLFSQNPFLMQIPAPALSAALELVKSGNLQEFQQRATANIPDPIIHPDMALSLALEAGFFSEIIWVLPQRSAETSIQLEPFRQKLLESGTATATEAQSFVIEEHAIHGTLRNTPFRVTSQRNLPTIESPTLTHIDLSFFKALYVNEIKTPLHPQIYQVMQSLRDARLATLGVSVSLANKTMTVSLQVRFVGDLLTRLLANPELLQQPLSGNDELRHQALYLANFFQKEKRLELYLEMAEAAPLDAAVKYDLYQVSADFKQGTEALAHLADAVALDPGFAVEYLALAEMALEKKRPDAALQMLDLAGAADPDNPFIDIRKGEILLQTGHPELTENILYNLEQLPWSDIYFPNIRTALLQKLTAE